MKYLFPVSFILNTFAMTALLIGLSLAKESQMAADVGIVQGATLALFYAFSANARNLILNPSSQITVRALLVKRLLLLAPLGIVAFYLSVYVAGVEGPLALALILRRGVEWVSELHLSEVELRGHQEFARKFIVVQSLLLFLALGWTLSDAPMHLLGLLLWALLPLLMSLGFVREHLAVAGRFAETWPRMIPHLGSTAIIGVTVYVFRLLILLIVGKETAGDLYAAFAIGGVLGSMFTNALGPSLVFHEVHNAKQSFPVMLKLSMFLWFVAGIAIFLAAKFSVGVLSWMEKPDLFWGTVGLSMIGGVVMVFAQRIRLRLLQLHGDRDVFGPDVLMNILIVACVPYLYYLVGQKALMALYLLSSVLALLLYVSAARGFLSSDQRLGLYADTYRRVIVFMLIFPLFFQLSGNVFHDSALFFDSEGALKRLPLPLSILACYLAIFLLGGFQRARTSLWFIFSSFVLMLISSVVSANGQVGDQQGKLLLLLQFVLPMLGLVLGQLYEVSENAVFLFEKVFLLVLGVLVPIQLLVSWLQGYTMLSSHLYLFSIYQHVQYVSVIFVCCYLIALYSLWQIHSSRKALLFLAPIMGVYAMASLSLLALFALSFGVLGFAVYRWIFQADRSLAVVFSLVVLGSALYFPVVNNPSAKDSGMFPQKFGFLEAELSKSKISLIEEFTQTPIAKRMRYWKYYAKSVVSSFEVFLFGHPERPERSVFPSAHNYYLDFVYNFGTLAVLPLVGLIGYTLWMIYRYSQTILSIPSLLGLTLVVVFLVFVDNSFKVGLRQPYSGIMTFFLWGVLLSRLSRLSQKMIDGSSATLAGHGLCAS